MPLTKRLGNTRITRRHGISFELRRMDADVVCLQEVWIGEDVEFLTKTLADVYPFSYSKLHHKGQVPPQIVPKVPPCNYLAASNFVTCIGRNKCIRKGNSIQQTYFCVVTTCFFEYLQLPQKCVSCVVSSFTQPTEAFAKCVGYGLPTLGMRDINEPGLVLLSKTPLINTRYHDFHPATKEIIERGYLEADTPDLGKIVCTHTASYTPFYYEAELWVAGVYNSYIEQGDSERGQLIERFGNVSPLLLMGDFNIGDSFGPLVRPALPREFQYMAMAFDVIPLKQCTLCGPLFNPYNGRAGKSYSEVTDTVVDHIFFKGHKVKDVVRVFTPLEAILLDGFPLSDHYGVMMVIEKC